MAAALGITTDNAIHGSLVALLGLAVVLAGNVLLVDVMTRSRPRLAIVWPTIAAIGVRCAAAATISTTSIAGSLRGGDEVTFLTRAHLIAGEPLGSPEWTGAFFGQLHIFLFALQEYLFASPEIALRFAQVGIAVGGLVLLATAVYDLAGHRAATVTMWILALEPTDIFFSGLLHKEANMTLAAGLVACGGAIIWKRGRLGGLLPIAAGCWIAVATRPYAGWFLIAAAAAIVLHAGLLQRREGGVRSLTFVALVAVLGAIAAPIVLDASSNESLEHLQKSQDANARNSRASLSLEQVDLSTRGAIVVNLPTRAFDLLVRPFPWQLQSLSQQVGLLGTAVAYAVLVLLGAELIRSWRSIMQRAGPLVYMGLFLLVAYALSAGNAGTGFRYRVHLVTIGICVIVTLRANRLQAAEETSPQPALDQRVPLPSGLTS